MQKAYYYESGRLFSPRVMELYPEISASSRELLKASFPKNIRLIMGLGNPGPRYRGTYHNAGHTCVEFLAKELAGKSFAAHRSQLFSYLKTKEFILVKSLVVMNESGKAARVALQAFRASPEELLVAHDDSDIPLGKAKFSFDRGPAGHRGVLSVIAALKTKRFFRARIGIRTTPGKAGSFVLQKPSPIKQKALYSAIYWIAENVTKKENF